MTPLKKVLWIWSIREKRKPLPWREQNVPDEKRQRLWREGNIMSYVLYVGGYLIIICGLIYGAVLLHVPAPWIIVGSVILLGIAVLTGVKATRQKDPN